MKYSTFKRNLSRTVLVLILFWIVSSIIWQPMIVFVPLILFFSIPFLYIFGMCISIIDLLLRNSFPKILTGDSLLKRIDEFQNWILWGYDESDE